MNAPSLVAPIKSAAAAVVVVHEGVTCARCGAPNIEGVRYSCSVCLGYDLCERCTGGGIAGQAVRDHDGDHRFIAIREALPPLKWLKPIGGAGAIPN